MNDLNIQKNQCTLPIGDWFKYIERTEHFFVYHLYTEIESRILFDATGFRFKQHLFRYQNNLGANFRDLGEYDSANKYFFSLIKNNDSRVLSLLQKGLEINNAVTHLLNNWETIKLNPDNTFDNFHALSLEVLFYGCTFPYLILEAIDYGRDNNEWNDKYQLVLDSAQVLRNVSKYFEMEPKVIQHFQNIAADKLNLSELNLARFLTPKELKNVLEGKIFIGESELKKRSEWCVFWSVSGAQSMHFCYNHAIVDSYSFLQETTIATKINEFVGRVAYKGNVRGVVKIVNAPSELNKFMKGEILVAQSTNPTLMPAIIICLGIITDEGGIASHAAIIARELKKPCIIGTKIATQVLKDGDLVEVDAERGIVTLLKRANEA